MAVADVLPVVAVAVPLLHEAFTTARALVWPRFHVSLDVLEHVREPRSLQLVADQARE